MMDNDKQTDETLQDNLDAVSSVDSDEVQETSNENEPLENVEKTESKDDTQIDDNSIEDSSESQSDTGTVEVQETEDAIHKNDAINQEDTDKTEDAHDDEQRGGEDTFEEQEVPTKDYESLEPEVLYGELQFLIGHFPVYKISKQANDIRAVFLKKVLELENQKKEEFIAEGGREEDFQYHNTLKLDFNKLHREYRAQIKAYYKQQESLQEENLEKRVALIDRLKALYTEPNDSYTSVFKEYRDIRAQWNKLGRVPAAKAREIFGNFFHHLDNFHEYLDLNKELREMNYEHNLETRKTIINRTKELLDETNIQKSLNELQYLHKLWKREAEPVAEEFKETTWQEFKALSDQLHEKKNELIEERKEQWVENLEKRQEIIKNIQEIVSKSDDNHRFYQRNAKQFEKWRNEFKNLQVARKDNDQTWNELKSTLREFNKKKNSFYKDQKKEQMANLEAKQKLVEIAQQNQDSDDWTVALDLYKDIQSKWKNIGHVPYKYSDEIWDKFQAACNHFFDRYKSRNNAQMEEWLQNHKKKEELLLAFEKEKIDTEKVQDTLDEWNKQWNTIGKIPKEKQDINKQYQALIEKKLKSAGYDDAKIYQIKNEQIIEKIKQEGDQDAVDQRRRVIRKKISDFKTELAQLETNRSFFTSADENHPVIKKMEKEITDMKNLIEKQKSELQLLSSITFDTVEESSDEDQQQENQEESSAEE